MARARQESMLVPLVMAIALFPLWLSSAFEAHEHDERSSSRVSPAELEREHLRPCLSLQGKKFDKCCDRKLKRADKLRTQYAATMTAVPVWEEPNKLSMALNLYSSLRKDLMGSGMSKDLLSLVRLTYVLDNMASVYAAMQMPNEAVALDEMLLKSNACKFKQSSSPPLERYEMCSAGHYQRLILHSRHVLRQPQRAIQWYEQSKTVRFDGKQVHLWTDASQTPTWFTPNLRSQPIWTEDLGIAAFLETHFATFQKDFLSFMSHAVYSNQSDQADFELITSGSWTDYHLLQEENTWHEACNDVVSASCKLLKSRDEFRHELDSDRVTRGPRMANGIGYLKLAPGTRLKAHNGATNARLVCHLGLQVPEGTGLRVGKAPATQWQVGKALCFDDSFDHEAWNDGAESRYVLYASVRHPDVRNLPLKRSHINL